MKLQLDTKGYKLRCMQIHKPAKPPDKKESASNKGSQSALGFKSVGVGRKKSYLLCVNQRRVHYTTDRITEGAMCMCVSSRLGLLRQEEGGSSFLSGDLLLCHMYRKQAESLLGRDARGSHCTGAA